MTPTKQRIAARRAKVAALAALGLAAKQIAYEIGVSREIIWSDAKALGLRLKGGPFRLTEADLRARIEAGGTYSSIGRELGVSRTAIRKRVVRLGWAIDYFSEGRFRHELVLQTRRTGAEH